MLLVFGSRTLIARLCYSLIKYSNVPSSFFLRGKELSINLLAQRCRWPAKRWDLHDLSAVVYRLIGSGLVKGMEPTGAVAKASLHRAIVTAYGPEPG